MNTRKFQPHRFIGKVISSPEVYNDIGLKSIPIIIIITPRVKMRLRIILDDTLPFFFLILKITLRAERKTNREGPNISKKAKRRPYKYLQSSSTHASAECAKIIKHIAKPLTKSIEAIRLGDDTSLISSIGISSFKYSTSGGVSTL